MNVHHGTLRLAILAALATSGTAAHAQAAQGEGTERTVRSALEEVVVTGTRAQDRTVAESLSPIDVLSASELETVGSPEVNQALSRLLPSFNFPRPSITDGTDHVRPAQLRGLAPDQTLVLVNGKRRHTTAIININGSIGRGSSPVDLNAIPASAIQRIEVLRDGASAQYGSDAIAGVVNIVLKDYDGGASADVRYGEHEEGDGELTDVAGWVGLPLGGDGYFTLSGEYRDRGFTNRSRADLRQQYPLIDGELDPREATFNRVDHRFGDAETEDSLVFLNGGIPISDSSELYFFANYSNRDGESAGFYRRALDARNVPAVHPDGFLPLIVSEADDLAAVAGLRGAAGEWDWDVSLNYGGSEFDFNVANSVNVTLGADSPTAFYAGTLENKQFLFNLDFVRQLSVGSLPGPLNVAFGAEYRDENYKIEPGEEASYIAGPFPGTPGAQVFPGFTPDNAADEGRHSYAAYLDLETDFTEKLSGSAAVRFEDYSDFGNETSGKLSARYAFTPDYAVRGTVSTGFRAPSLSQQFYSTTATNFISGVPFQVRTFPVDDPVAVALGAEPLEAETSVNYSLGFVAQPTDSLYFTIDAYRIEIDDRIVLSENLTGDAVRAFLEANGIFGVNGGRYFTNAIDTTTDGIDLVGRYSHNFANGSNLGLTLGYNHTETEIDRIAPNPPELEEGGLELLRIDRVEIGRITKGTPKDKIILGADYSFAGWLFRVNGTRYGEWSVLDSNPAEDQTFGAEIVIDASVSYTWRDHLTLTVGADNLTDEYPDEVIPENAFPNLPLSLQSKILPYSSVSPFGFNGRFVYGRLKYDF